MLEKIKRTAAYQNWLQIKEDMKPMPFWKKVGHLWYCYRLYICFFCACVFMVGIIIGSYISASSKEALVSGMLVNMSVTQEGMNYLSTEYEEYLGAEEHQYVSLEYTQFGPLDDPFNADDNYNKAMVMIARVEGQMLDYMLLDALAMKTYVIYDLYLDLREFFTPEELAQFEAEGKVKYAQYEGDTDKRPVAVDISDTAFVKDTMNGASPIYFALSGHNPKMDKCHNAWDYIHAWESKAE